jgi:hypothetical protein
MKSQDVAFILALIVLFIARKPKFFVYAGLVSLLLAMPLFAGWVFFTAERATWYAAAFFLIALIFSNNLPDKKNRS